MDKKIIIFLCAFMLSTFSCAYVHSSDNADNKYVRVAIVKNADDAVVSVRGVFSITNPANGSVLERDRVLRRSRTKNIKGVIHIGKSKFNTRKIRLSSKKDMTVRIGNKDRRFRGSLDVIANKDGTLTIINIIELEKYIRGVLYHEVSSRWPMEATKAQAVAVRSYVMYQMKIRKNYDYDVTSDIYSQVYGGRSAERYRTNIAAKETKGEILTFKGEILPAYYHSNSGGHTEDASELWDHDLAPLKGVQDDFVSDAPNSYWRKNFRSKDVQDKLNEKGEDIGLIKDIRVIERNRSGRVRKIEIEDRSGKKVVITGKAFRNIVGPNNIKSNKFNVIMKGYFFDVEGSGWGHGVGMSQWGANGMAKQGYGYKAILNYYYPGAKLVDYRKEKVTGI